MNSIHMRTHIYYYSYYDMNGHGAANDAPKQCVTLFVYELGVFT